MAVYDPPQPLWKRNLAGILDFLLAATVFGLVLYQFVPKTMPVTATNAGPREIFGLGPWASLGLLALIMCISSCSDEPAGPYFSGSSG
jgi:hypothetical protein